MDFRVLGRLEVEADGVDRTPLRPREQVVLGALLLRRNREAGVEELIDAVWGPDPPRTARTALHGHISSLRHQLGRDRIESRPRGYALRLRDGDRIDADRFAKLVVAAGTEPALARAELLREGLDLFRRPLLANIEFASGDGDLATELASERARLDELGLAAEEQRAAADLELGRAADVVARLTRLTAEHPLREGLRAQLMLGLYRSGRQADALAVAGDIRRILAEELGVEPGPSLQRLELQILDHDAALMVAPSSRAAAESDDRAHAAALPSGGVTFLALDRATGDPSTPEGPEAIGVRHGGCAVMAAAEIAGSPLILAFARARDAAAAAAAIQRLGARGGPVPRIGLHSATAVPAGSKYPDSALDRAARLQAVAHPGQVVLTQATRDLLREAQSDEAETRDLGRHRLADLLLPEPLYQLIAGGLTVDFPPVRDLEAHATNLPAQPTPIIGRGREIAAITGLLRGEATRLVTLVGPGGVGKTRLAVHAAAEMLGQARDGVWFVPLEAVTDPSTVVGEIARAVGVAEGGPSALSATLLRALAGRSMLLVLDNLEHLLPAAPFVHDISRAAPTVKVLATSRTPLKVEGEVVFHVGPLATPEEPRRLGSDADLGDLPAVGSVALFTERARAARPGFWLTSENASPVAELCRSLDGLPLAIELAAAHIAILPPAALVERLAEQLRVLRLTRRQGPGRHRALQVAVDWSHDLLGSDDQRLFASVAVFAGGWTLEAAEALLAGGADVIDGLGNLVDQSLVQVAGTEVQPRFRMLEPIRQYAAAKLDVSGMRQELERRHAAFFVTIAEAAESSLRGNPGPARANLELEHDNLRAALDRLDASGESELEARLAGALWRFWYLGGHLSEGRRRLDRALANHSAPTAARAKTLIGAAVMAVNTEDASAARRRAAEGLALHRELGDAWGAAYCTFMLGGAAELSEDREAARKLFEDALAAFRGLGDEHTALLVSRSLAGILAALGDLPEARALYGENLRRAREEHDGRLEATSLGALASIAFDEGRTGDARWMLLESLLLHRELGDRLDSAVDLARAARTLAMAGHAPVAAQLVGALASIRDDLGLRRQGVAVTIDDVLASLRRRLPEAELLSARQAGAALDLDAALGLALEALRS